jgi:hypothetical protein
VISADKLALLIAEGRAPLLGIRSAFGTVVGLSGTDQVMVRPDSSTQSMGPLFVVTGKAKVNDRVLLTYLPDQAVWVVWAAAVSWISPFHSDRSSIDGSPNPTFVPSSDVYTGGTAATFEVVRRRATTPFDDMETVYSTSITAPTTSLQRTSLRQFVYGLEADEASGFYLRLKTFRTIGGVPTLQLFTSAFFSPQNVAGPDFESGVTRLFIPFVQMSLDATGIPLDPERAQGHAHGSIYAVTHEGPGGLIGAPAMDNPLDKSKSGSEVGAFPAGTRRTLWTYTVPSDRLALVTGYSVSIDSPGMAARVTTGGQVRAGITIGGAPIFEAVQVAHAPADSLSNSDISILVTGSTTILGYWWPNATDSSTASASATITEFSLPA